MSTLPQPFKVAALYRFADLEDYRELRAPLLAFCESAGIGGTLLLAPEGINGTVAGSDEAIDALIAMLAGDEVFAGRLRDLEVKYSRAAAMPFRRLKIKLKPEIVALCAGRVDPRERVGTYVEPEDWNALLRDPDVLVIDTRNRFEVAMGTFEGAVDPETRKFSQFPDFARRALDRTRHRRIAMFCTGGIRCEKASAYLLQQGFEEVLHLKGGILRYLETVPEAESLWRGDCFVFDERVALGHGLEQRVYADASEPSEEGSSRR